MDAAALSEGEHESQIKVRKKRRKKQLTTEGTTGSSKKKIGIRENSDVSEGR